MQFFRDCSLTIAKGEGGGGVQSEWAYNFQKRLKVVGTFFSDGKKGGTIFTFCDFRVFIPKVALNLNQELQSKLFKRTQTTPKNLKFPRETLHCVSIN